MLGKSTSRRSAVLKSSRFAPRAARQLREVGWLAAVGLAVYLGMILLTYHGSDPGWSRTGMDQPVANSGGHFGACAADLLL